MLCKGTNRKGKPCLRRAIGSNGFCRSHDPQDSKRPSTGRAFEEQVFKVLRSLGYKVERNLNVNGCQIDVYGEYRTGIITLRLMVECKDYGTGKTVGIDEMNKFAGVLAVARNIGVVDKGLFVTTHGYTAAAKLNARSAGIELTTYRELSTQLIDFGDYLDRIMGEFRSSPVSKCYIDLSGTEVEDYEGADDSVFHRPIEDYINQHLFVDGHGKLGLLGNFGTGKSTFCHKYAHDLAKMYKMNEAARIPIVVNLSDYDSKLHIQQLILNTLQFRYNVNITYTLCQELQRLGRFVLLFDGFDEMATRADADTIRDNLREINKVAEITENKFILTCRTHFFRDRVQAEILTDFDILYIPEWGERELKEYVQKRLGSEWENQLERIVGTHNLPELAQTPLFLEMIVETLPKLGDEVKRIELYQVYTDNWIKDQSRRKGARLDAQQRSQFVKELAMKLYVEDRLACHHSEFVPILRQRFEVDDAAQMDYLRSDVQTCAFLIRDSDGNYRFRHQSFMEFFVGRTLAEEVRQGLEEHLAIKLLPLEIRGFLVDFLSTDPPADLLKVWLQDAQQQQTLRDNALSLLTRLKVSISDTRLDREPEKATEARITAEFIQGDVEAFDTLYDRYKPQLAAWVERYIRFRMGRHDLTEDIVIDTFISAWQYRDRLTRVSDLRAYLLRIAQNKCVDLLRRERYYSQRVSIDDLLMDPVLSSEVPAEQSPEPTFIAGQLISEAITHLSKREQQVVLGTIAEGKTSEEVAREIGVTSRTVRRIRHASLEKLRLLLKDIEGKNEA
jgi:RNA polymerase sigma factor (sigma-70 family)